MHCVKECPKCAGDTKVIDSRISVCHVLYRRRKCLVCGRIFKTFEITEDDYKMIVKKGKDK